MQTDDMYDMPSLLLLLLFCFFLHKYLVLMMLNLIDFICCFFYPEKDLTASRTINHVENTTSLGIENSTASVVENTIVSAEKNHTDNKTQQPSTVQNKIILCIQIFGCVDILLICTYSAVCIYDRQHQTAGKVNTYENIPGNNSAYENAEIFSISTTGNQLV